MKNRSMALDALRGIAALFVVLFHAKQLNLVGLPAIWHSNRLSPDLNGFFSYLIVPFTFFGFYMVALFFVISGYCIHRPNISKLSKDPNHKLDLGEYFKRRIWRIYPVLIATMVLTFLFDYYTSSHFPTDRNLGDTSWKVAIINLLSLQNIVGPSYGSNAPFWTLGMELHFYFLYPILFWLTKKIGPIKTTLAVLLVSIVSTIILRVIHSSVLIFLPFWFTWMIGFYIAECEIGRVSINTRKLRYATGISLAIGIFLVVKRDHFLALPFFGPCFGALLLWSLNDKSKWFWDKPWAHMFAHIGIFSYSLYAIHYPFLIFMRALFTDGKPSAYIAIPLLFTLLSVVLAIGLFWLVEKWSLKVPKRKQTTSMQESPLSTSLPSTAE